MLKAALAFVFVLVASVPVASVQSPPMGIPDFCPGSVVSGVISTPTTLDCAKVVAGSSLTINAALTVRTLYGDGTLTVNNGGSITFTDAPIDTSADPERWGHGLIWYGGVVRMNGTPKTPFVRLGAEVLSGQSTLMLGAAVQGWSVGDRLVLPDSRQDRGGPLDPSDFTPGIGLTSQSETVTIQAINGSTVTLSGPVQFDHKGARWPDGTLKRLPHVGNLTRSITLRSANPNGVRGHVVFLHRADVTMVGVELAGLGRTDADCPDTATDLLDGLQNCLDSTTFNADGTVKRIGTSQIGRYALHLHHLMGPVSPQPNGKQYTLSHLSVHGNRKWAIAVHNTHYGLIQDSVVAFGEGAGIVTEDGSETANVFQRNFIAAFNNFGAVLSQGEAGNPVDPFMRQGMGFGLRGPSSELRENVVADTREAYAYNTAGFETGPTSVNVIVRVPKAQGVDTTIDANVTEMPVFHRKRLTNETNEAYGVTRYGIGLWFAAWEDDAPMVHPIIWHVTPGTSTSWKHAAVLGKYAEFKIVNPEFINEGGLGQAFSQFNDASGFIGRLLTVPSFITGGDVRGFRVFYNRVGQLAEAPWWEWKDTVIQVEVGFTHNNGGEQAGPSLIQSTKFLWKNLRWVALPGKPLTTIALTQVPMTLPHPFTMTVEDYQQVTGQNFRVYFPQSTDGGVTNPPATANATAHPEIAGLTDASGPTPPPNPCVVNPLKVTGLKWPAQPTGSRSLSWNSGAFVIDRVVYERKPVVTATFTDDRGCTVTVTK